MGAGVLANIPVQAGEPGVGSATTVRRTIGTGFPFWRPVECSFAGFILISSTT